MVNHRVWRLAPRNVSPGWPDCPPVFLPERSRRLLTRGGLFNPSLDGGLPLLLLFSARDGAPTGKRLPLLRQQQDERILRQLVERSAIHRLLGLADPSRAHHHLQSVPPKGTWALLKCN